MAASIADLVNTLFQTHRRPDGQEYSNSEISRALGGEIAPSSLSKLRRGEIPNPGRDTLLLLCRFFKVPASYFFPELDLPPAAPDQPEPLSLALRSTNLDAAVQQKLEELITAMQLEKRKEV